jgi:hypothetical protein
MTGFGPISDCQTKGRYQVIQSRITVISVFAG